MKIHVENLGPLRQAEFELGDLTIICGENNTGKTYATYALYSFLVFWREVFFVEIQDEYITKLLSDGAVSINILQYVDQAEDILKKGCEKYTEYLPFVFAAPKERFTLSSFAVTLGQQSIKPAESYEHQTRALKTVLFSIVKTKGNQNVSISLLVERERLHIDRSPLKLVIGVAVKDILFSTLFPEPFIASAERTGAAIFRKDLDLWRSRVMEQAGKYGDEVISGESLSKTYKGYALPVHRNVEFMRKLEDAAKNSSFIADRHPELLEAFSDIIGGAYTVTSQDELFFLPRGKDVRLTMDESSSAVRSLLCVGFYLRHVAKEHDLLMIDEPELNLHPENQRRVARLLARLVNLGIKVFITTHSDYIIKELNTLIMLKNGKRGLKKIAREEGYKPEEFLLAEKVRAYIAEPEPEAPADKKKKRARGYTLTPADITQELGIEARSFDRTIDEMNRIQDRIYFE